MVDLWIFCSFTIFSFLHKYECSHFLATPAIPEDQSMILVGSLATLRKVTPSALNMPAAS